MNGYVEVLQLSILVDRLQQFFAGLAAHTQIGDQPHGAEVDQFDDTQHGHAHEEAEQTSAVGKEVRGAVELGAARSQELSLLEEYGYAGHFHPKDGG